ncbi:MAG: sulfotransferase family protein [Planctomycetota bacterium]|nr:MAG: sulfotransferase family protein [Planctomycetota bacterium]
MHPADNRALHHHLYIASMARDFTTIVSGLPRSGTSMAMQMIVAGGIAPLTDAARTADDDNPRGYYELDRVKQLASDKSWLDEARGKVVKVIHMLVAQLPDDRAYRVVFLDRDLREVVQSQSTMLARNAKIGATIPADRLMSIYDAQLKQVHTWLSARSNFGVLVVKHADLMSDGATQARRMNAFLGGDLNEAAMANAIDPSLHRNKV